MIRSSKSSACASVRRALVARVDVADDLLGGGARVVRPLLGGDEFVLQVADLRGDRPRRDSASGRDRGRGSPSSSAAASRRRRRSRTRTSARASLPSLRRIRTHIEWNVDTHMVRARGPTSRATRSFISPAALLVKVIARISYGDTSRSAMRYAIAVRQHAGLAGSGAGDDQQRAAAVLDRRALLRIQPVQQGRRIDREAVLGRDNAGAGGTARGRPGRGRTAHRRRVRRDRSSQHRAYDRPPTSAPARLACGGTFRTLVMAGIPAAPNDPRPGSVRP